jgi:hypothetical protein
MGSYASVSDVQALITTDEFTISVSSEPSTTKVDEFIAQAEGEVNGVLTAQGYSSVPAGGSNDVAMLKGYIAPKVAATVWLVAFLDDDPPYRVKEWLNAYREFLNRLRQGQQHLVDQLPQGDEGPIFGIVRHPTRDDYFTNRADQTDWDE